MFAPIVYSPRKVEDYLIRSVPSCEVNEILKLEQWPAVWNLFWLSVPTVDTLPDSGINWWAHYQPAEGLLAAIIDDVLSEEPLYRRLMARPEKFLDFWCRTDISVYETYGVLGDAWAETVLTRGHEARDRLAGKVLGRQGNVVTAKFGRRAA